MTPDTVTTTQLRHLRGQSGYQHSRTSVLTLRLVAALRASGLARPKAGVDEILCELTLDALQRAGIEIDLDHYAANHLPAGNGDEPPTA